MGDPELEAIRKQRLTQMQSQYNAGDATNQEEKIKAQEDTKNAILASILDQQARARLNTLMLGKPEKGKMLESMLVNMAQRGQVRNRINEQELIGLIESVNAQMPQNKSTVKFDRRRAALDSDDDDF